MIKIKKKIFPIVMSILCAFSFFTGNIKAANYVLHVETPYGMNADKTYKWTIGLTQFTNAGVDDEVFAKLTLDGVGDVFCIEPLKNTIDGAGDYQSSALSTFVPSVPVQKRLGYISALGFGMDKSDEMRFATQIRIWQEAFPNLVDNSTIHADIQSKINDINNRLKVMETDVSFKGQEIVLSGYGKDKAVTLTDTTNSFSNYVPNKISGVHTEKSANTLKIWAEKGDSLQATLEYDCYYLADIKATHLAFYSPTSQGVGRFGRSDPAQFSLKVRMAVGDLRITKQDEDSTYIPNTSFKLSYNADMSDPIGTYTTDSSGKVDVSNLIAQTVYVQEISAPSHLVVDSAIKSVTIQDGKMATHVARNNWVKGKVLLKKTDKDSGKQIANGTYAIYNTNNVEVDRVVTSANGYVESGYLRFGDYYVKEVIAPNKYLINNNKYPITISSNEQKINVLDSDKRVVGVANLTKVDNDLNATKPLGDGTLEGAVYGLYARENILDPADSGVIHSKNSLVKSVTIKNSKAQVTDLYLGKYYWKEMKASTGYQLDTNEYDFELKYANQTTATITNSTTVKEKVIDGDFQITKVKKVYEDSEINEPEKNAEFQVVLKKYVTRYDGFENAMKHTSEYSDREYDVLTTDEDGIAKSKKLAYGTYVVKQTKTGSEDLSLLKEEFEVKIDKVNQPTIKYVISNQKFLSYLQLKKKDNETGKVITLNSATFKIFDVDENKYVSQRLGTSHYDEWKTDDEGKVTLPLKLKSGHYRLEEIKAPTGFLLNTETIDFEIKSSYVSIVDEENQPITIIAMTDEKPTAKIIMNKTYEREEDNGLGGTVFQLKADTKIVNATNGKTIYEKGDVVNVDGAENGLYTVNEIGRLEIDNLPIGIEKAVYTLTEYSTLDGYVLDDKEFTFEFNQKDDTTKEYVEEKEVENIQTQVEFNKLHFGTEKHLKGVKLELRDLDGKVIEEWTTSDKGHVVKGLLVNKKYVLHEVESIDGFSLAKDVFFIVKNTKDVQEVVMYNKVKPTAKIIMNKTYEREEDNALGGTVFQLKADTKIVDMTDEKTIYEKGDVVNVDGAENGLYTVNESGKLVIGDLPIGIDKTAYTLTEYSTLDGYVLDDKEFTFEFEKKDEITKEYVKEDEVENVLTQVEIYKKDLAYKNNLKGVKLELQNEDGEVIEEWTTGDKGHVVKGLLVNHEYTVHEVQPLKDYKNTDDVKFNVKNTKDVQEVNIYNEKKPIEVKTNDTSNVSHLLGLVGLSLIVISGVVMIKRKKEDKMNVKKN